MGCDRCHGLKHDGRDIFRIHHLWLPLLRLHPLRPRHDTVGLHEGGELLGDLSQNLLGQVEPGHLRVQPSLQESLEGHELHDVAGSLLAGVVGESDGVAVKLLHGGEVGVTHAHDDD